MSRRIILLVCLCMVFMALASTAYGKPAKGVTKTGTSGPDNLVGTTSADTLKGVGGSDTFDAMSGADNVQGGLGKDVIPASAGQDTITGGDGSDYIRASQNGDGTYDNIDCGLGLDFAYINGGYEGNLTNCEQVQPATTLPNWSPTTGVDDPDNDNWPNSGSTAFLDDCPTEAGPNNGCPVTQPPPATEPNVCAHWHVAAQKAVGVGPNPGPAADAEYDAEMAKAADMGIECFAINLNGWGTADNGGYVTATDILWAAANRWNTAHPTQKIYLYPSIDTASITDDATIRTISRYKYNDPARLRVDGGVHGNNLPVTQTWHGENLKTPAGWDTFLDNEAANGFPVFFMPYFDKNAFGGYSQMVDAYNGANNAIESDDIVDGFYNFGGIASGDNSEAGYQGNQALDSAVDASPGMDAQIGCTPNFNRHSQQGAGGGFNNRIVGDHEGFHAFNKCMQGYAFEQKPRFMEFTTWNDYIEGTYLGGPYTQAQLPSDYDGNYMSHDAFRKLGAKYITAYEAGATSVDNSKDFIAIAHRPHAEGATSTTGTNDSIGLPKQVDYSVVEDRLYAVVVLKSPGDVTLTSGGTSQTFAQPAGVSEISMPFNAGTQSISLARGGTQSLSATSSVQVTLGPVTLFNFNVNTAYAQE